MTSRRAMRSLWLAWLLLTAAPAAWAQDVGGMTAFEPPCGATDMPGYAAIGAAPNIGMWAGRADLGRHIPPGCIPWDLAKSTDVIAVAAQFKHAGPVEELLGRFGAISSMQTIRYWSVTDGRWAQLIRRSMALSAANAADPRPDFTVDELRSGNDLFFLQEENRTSPTVYRMRVTVFSVDSFLIELENINAIRLMLIPLVGPGAFHTASLLNRIDAEHWGYYAVVGNSGLGGFSSNRKSVINRAVATFRHVAGLPTDQEPPVAP